MIKNNLISITLKLLFHTRSFSFIAFLIFLSICFPRAYATESGIFNFSNINLKNGLSQLSVLAIAQDSKGYIWFATRNGLNKYDGEKFTIYKHDNDDPHSLSDNHITCLLPDDANEGLWVGTNNGLNYINLKTNQITKYQTDDYPNMPGNNIAVLQFDQSGNLWVGTRTGLCIWQPRSGEFKKKYSDHVPENEAIMQLYIDAEKRLYIGTHRHGLFICTPEMELIQQLNKSTQPALSDDAISCIFEDSQHQVWIGTETRGLNKWNPKTKDLSIYNQKNSGLTNDYIRCITEQDQKLIIGTFDGLSILDLRDDDISKYNRFDANQNSLSHFSVRSIYIDREKTLWVGTYSGGVNYYNPLNNRFIFYHPVENNNQKLYNIFGTMVYDSTSLWIATEGGGLMQFNPITKEYTNFLIEQTSKGLFNKNIIKSLLLDGDYIWCGTSTGGVYKFHIPSKKFTLVYSFGREKNFAIYTFYKDAENNLWIGTTADKGLVKLSPDGKITNQFPYGKEKKEFVNFTSLRSFLALNAHTFLIGTRSFGLYEYDMQKGTVLRCNMSETNPNQKLENNYITSMVRKANGEIWFSTFGGGIYLYKQGTGVVKHIGKKEGLPNNEVYAMVEHNNNLWISVDKELLLVNQLMDLQKNQSGNLTLQLSQSDLNAFLLEIFYTFRQIAESKQIRFEYQAPQGEVTACFDQGLLEKAVFNLLSNAFKFTVPRDTITLRLLLITDIDTLRQEHSDWLSEHSPLITTHQGSYLVIQVADTGKGIPEDERTQIFTPFYQVGHTTGSENMNGTGIGLSLTQSVVHLHHGEIGVTANTPKGSVFTILLPNHTMTEEEVADTAVLSEKNNEQVEKGMSGAIDSENTISGTTPSLPGKTVLLVEDNEEIRSYVKGHLEQYYNVLEADNGSDAFEIVLKEFPDLVVTDIMMPGIDGLELCSLIKNNLQTGHIPVILLTARTMVMHVKEGFLSGADDYVVKPFNIDVLLVRIYNLLAQREKLKSVYSKNFSLQSMGIEVETTSADEKFMQKLFKIIEKYLTDPDLKVDKICEEMGFSRSNLYRKLKAITDLPLNDLIRHKRLEIATQMLKQTEMNITEIATATGFSTLAYFTKCFKSAYGVSPSEYQKSHSGHTDVDTIRE